MQGIVNAVFTLFHFNFCGTANLDHSNTAGQFRQAFLQLFTVIIRCCGFNLRTDLTATTFNRLFLTRAINDGCVFFGDVHCFSRAQHIQRNSFQLDAKIFGNHLTTGQDRKIFQHRFTAITKTRGFNSGDFQATTQLIHHQCSQCLAFHIFRNDQQRTAGLYNSFQQRQHWLQVCQLGFVQQDERIFHLY